MRIFAFLQKAQNDGSGVDFLLWLRLATRWVATLKMTKTSYHRKMTKIHRHCATKRFLSVIASEPQSERGNPR